MMHLSLKKVFLSVVVIVAVGQTILIINPIVVRASNSGYVCLDTNTFYDPNVEASSHKIGYCNNGFTGLKIPTSGYICTDLNTIYDPNVASTVSETDSTYHKIGYCSNGFSGKKVIMGQPIGTNETVYAGGETSTATTTTGATAPTGVADECNSGFLGFPAWYRGLTMDDGSCDIKSPGADLSGFIWHVALNILEMAIMAVVYITVFFILFGGFQFLTSQGSPDGSAKARTTILNAVIGLVISLVAVGIINFIVTGLLI